MKLLVTGGAGFIGSNLTKVLLDSGHDVRVIDNLSKGHKDSIDNRAEFIRADIKDETRVKKALSGVDAVLHLSGFIVVPESVSDPTKYFDNNVLGAINLLEAMKNSKVKKIIFSSSACVYGTPDKLPVKEDAQLHPDNPYGASKAAIEAFLESYHAIYDFDVTILRYFNPYGPGERHDPETHAIPNFVRATLAKNPIPLYWQGEQIRDFIYINDLVKAHVDVLDLDGFNIFNVGTETGVKVKDVLDEIFKIVGYRAPIKDLGKRPGDVRTNYASSEKLTKAVAWRAEVSLKEGLKKTVEYYKNNL